MDILTYAMARKSGGGSSSFGKTTIQENYDFKITPAVHFEGLGFLWYKFSDLTPTDEQLLLAEITESGMDSTGAAATNKETPAEDNFIVKSEELSGFTTAMGLYVVARKAGTIDAGVTTVDVPEPGMYFGWGTESVPADYDMVVSIKYDEVVKIPAECIPDELYAEIDNKIEDYIEEALGGEY